MNDIPVQQQVAAHDARNRQLLASLAAKGVELEVVRRVDLYFCSRSEADARELVAALEASKFDAVHANVASGAEAGADWNIVAGVNAAPQAVAATDFTRFLVHLALAHGSDYDGWGTEA